MNTVTLDGHVFYVINDQLMIYIDDGEVCREYYESMIKLIKKDNTCDEETVLIMKCFNDYYRKNGVGGG